MSLGNVHPYTVPVSGSLLDVLHTLEAASTAIALVVDHDGRLIGTLTDGDVRRALLAGAPLQDPLDRHMQRQFITVGPEASRASVLERMRAGQIQQVPVVSADGSLIGLHLLREMIGPTERPNWGVIMAGGQGMRLRPLTETIPKPMIPVAGRPILERIVLHMVGFGVRHIFLAINHLGPVVEAHFGDGRAFGCRIEYVREQEPLGTAGALSLLPERPTAPILVMNGDLVTQADLGALLRFHDDHGSALTLGVRPYVHTVPFGCVEMQGPQVVQLAEKPQLTRMVNTGIYAVSPAAHALLAPGKPATMPGLAEQCLALGMPVSGFEVHDDWLDVGQFDQLKQAREGYV